jgi:hypothetical protein
LIPDVLEKINDREKKILKCYLIYELRLKLSSTGPQDSPSCAIESDPSTGLAGIRGAQKTDRATQRRRGQSDKAHTAAAAQETCR